MVFKSPVQDVFLESDFGSILTQVKDLQLSFTMSKMDDFNFKEKDFFEEIMPEDTPEILLQRRRKLKALRKCRTKNSDIG